MIQAPERNHRDTPVLQCTAIQAKCSAAAIHIAHERAVSTPSLVCTGRPPPARAADRPSRLRRVSLTCPASLQRHRSNPARHQANRRIPTEQSVETQSNLKQHSPPIQSSPRPSDTQQIGSFASYTACSWSNHPQRHLRSPCPTRTCTKYSPRTPLHNAQVFAPSHRHPALISAN